MVKFRSQIFEIFESGLIIKLPCFDRMDPEEYFDDRKHWDGVIPIDTDLESQDQGFKTYESLVMQKPDLGCQ